MPPWNLLSQFTLLGTISWISICKTWHIRLEVRGLLAAQSPCPYHFLVHICISTLCLLWMYNHSHICGHVPSRACLLYFCITSDHVFALIMPLVIWMCMHSVFVDTCNLPNMFEIFWSVYRCSLWEFIILTLDQRLHVNEGKPFQNTTCLFWGIIWKNQVPKLNFLDLA